MDRNTSADVSHVIRFFLSSVLCIVFPSTVITFIVSGNFSAFVLLFSLSFSAKSIGLSPPAFPISSTKKIPNITSAIMLLDYQRLLIYHANVLASFVMSAMEYTLMHTRTA